jgi:hypothetical protein
MTIVPQTFLTFSAIGNREDLADMIYNIDPVETPFQAMVDKTKASAVLHEWQTQALAPAAQNAQLEGDEAAFTAVTPTVRVNNRCQIARKTVIVSGTQEAVDKAGREGEMAYQMVLKNKELRRDMEFDLCGNQAPVTGNSTTARQLRPLCGWYATNDVRATAGTPGADGTTAAAATDGTQVALTEAMVKTAMANCWTNGGKPTKMMCGPVNKVKISAFTANTTRYQDTSDKRLVTSLEIYDTDFGPLAIVPNRFQRERDVHILQPDMWAIAYLRKVFTKDLAATGDADKAMLTTEFTLECRNEKSSAVVADLTTVP